MDKVDPDENRLIAERRRKLTEARDRGVAFPNEFRRDVLADQLHASFGERWRVRRLRSASAVV